MYIKERACLHEPNKYEYEMVEVSGTVARNPQVDNLEVVSARLYGSRSIDALTLSPTEPTLAHTYTYVVIWPDCGGPADVLG